MRYETTAYIREDILAGLNSAALSLNISRSELISLLLLRFTGCKRAPGMTFRKLKYQGSGPDISYRTVCFCLREDVYERWCDVRKVFKLSGSFIIALAYQLYMNEILTEYDDNPDRPFNYGSIYISKISYDAHSYINMIIWGQPGEKTLEKIQQIP